MASVITTKTSTVFVAMAMLCTLAVSSIAGASERVLADMMTLYVGESKVIEAPGVIRMTVGQSDLISTTLLDNSEIVLIAEKSGETNIQIWFSDGHRESMPIVVVESNGWREQLEVQALLKNVKGVSVTTIGRRIVIDGTVEERELDRIKAIKDRYKDILDLSRVISDFEQKMLYFDVQVTEINRDVTEELGINWSKSFSGPTLGYEKAWSTNTLGLNENAAGETPRAQAYIDGIDVVGSAIGSVPLTDQSRLLRAAGSEYLYWGVSTSLVSMINMLEQTGAAITLSEPRLSARSGGMANLTVGGEIPVVTSSVSGQTVSYKDYGIILSMEPALDMYNNIRARVSVSVSQLDLSNAVDGQPAFKKRYTENDIKLKPGETLALSGLITREEQLAYSGLKWLSDIPVLGKLFQSKSFTSGETELVILITPRIIEDLAQGENKALVERSKALVEEFEAKAIELME